MPMPTVVAVGTVAAGQANITPGLPAGWAQDDIFVLPVESQNELVDPPTGYALLNALTVIVSTGSITRLTVFWKRATASESAPTVVDPGTLNHMIGRIIAVRDCVTTGNPWNTTSSGTELVSDTSVAIVGATTTAPDCLVLAMFTTGTDTNTAQLSGPFVNADLANIATQMNNWTAQGAGGGLAMCSGEKATAGAYGATTANILTLNFKAFATVALQGAAAGTNANAENAAATGAAQQATAAVTVNADVATGSGSASDATVQTGTAAQAESAAGAGSAADASVAVAANAGVGSGSGVAPDATAGIAVTAGSATSSGTAHDATITVGVAATAENAAGVGSASDASAAVGAQAGPASGSGSAADASVSVASGAEVASGSGVASDATVQVTGSTNANAENAAGIGSAADASVDVGASAGVASATGTASDAAAALAVLADVAAALGEALELSFATLPGYVRAGSDVSGVVLAGSQRWPV